MRITTARGPLVLWSPAGYQGRAVVVYVHGFGDTIDSAVANHKLIEQFKRSGVKARFVVPAARARVADSVHFPSLTELLELAGAGNANHVTAIAHSGGNAELRRWIAEGDPRLKNIILLDALYRGYDTFAGWAKKPGHWIALVGFGTARETKRLADELGVPYHQGKSHMRIVTGGRWIPGLLGDAPVPSGLHGLAVLALAAALGYAIYRCG